MNKNRGIRFLAVLFSMCLLLGIIPGMPGAGVNSVNAESSGSPVLTGHNSYYLIGEDSVYLDPNFKVEYSGTINGGKVYIDSNFVWFLDCLLFTDGNGITGNYNPSNGVLTLTGEASAADYQAFIRNIKFSTTTLSNIPKTVVVTLNTDNEDVFYYSGTGHYYEYVADYGITWQDAKAAAEARTYMGLTGYLATITSADENSFVAAKCAGDGWLGGSDEGHDKEWYWVTGPEAGNKFCQQNELPYGSGVAYTVDGWYQNFASGEPNDFPDGEANGENYLHMYSEDGKWNDYAGDNPAITGYLVEYGVENTRPSGSMAVIDVILTYTPISHAETPVFTANLSGSKVYAKGDSAQSLNVETTVSDNGVITYQWYVNGIPINGATCKSYTPNTDKTGVFEYYVVATNTNSSASGEKTATAQSGTYRVTVHNASVNADIADNAPKVAIREDRQSVLDAALTDEDKAKLQNGYDITVNLKVGNITNAPQDEQKAVCQIIGDNTFGQYVDISLLKRLVDADGKVSEERIKQLKAPLTITIEIPENLLPKDGSTRTFSIIRVHDGVATVLQDLDDNPNTITIKTDSFSTYAIVYKDYKDNSPKAPKTGDKPLIAVYALAFASLLTLGFAQKRRVKA